MVYSYVNENIPMIHFHVKISNMVKNFQDVIHIYVSSDVLSILSIDNREIMVSQPGTKQAALSLSYPRISDKNQNFLLFPLFISFFNFFNYTFKVIIISVK